MKLEHMKEKKIIKIPLKL